MASDALLFAYVLLMMLGLSVLAILSEVRRRRFRPTKEADRIFRCEKCGSVYTDDPDVDRSRCSQCGTTNEAIQF